MERIRKRSTYLKWMEYEQFLEQCPSNRKVLKFIFDLLDDARAFHSETNAYHNFVAMCQVIKDSSCIDKHGQ